MKKTWLKRVVKVFSVDYVIDTNDILDIDIYLMKETYKIMFGFIKKWFVGLLSVCARGCFGESLASNYREPIKQSIMQSKTNNCKK